MLVVSRIVSLTDCGVSEGFVPNECIEDFAISLDNSNFVRVALDEVFDLIESYFKRVLIQDSVEVLSSHLKACNCEITVFCFHGMIVSFF